MKKRILQQLQKQTKFYIKLINYMQLTQVYNLENTKDARMAAIVHRDFKQSTILAPIEVKLKEIQNQYQLVEIKRDPNNPDIEKQVRLNSIFQDKMKYNCMSKYKAYKSEDTSFNPKLAICVCAYNQDKRMLRQSLRGIYDSLQYFQGKAGIKSEQIVVVVVFDGIEKMRNGEFSSNMVSIFDEVDFLNGSILRQGEISYQQAFQSQKININEIGENDQIWKNISTLSKAQIEQHKKRRFRTKYEYYMRMKQLQQQSQSTNRTYEFEKLSPEVRTIYDNLVKDYTTKLNEQEIRLVRRKKPQEILQIKQKFQKIKEAELRQFKTRKALIEKAYRQSYRLTKRFFQSRKETSLVYGFQYKPRKAFNSISDEDGDKYLNVLLAIKHANQGKLSSHSLFLLGFCKLMQPEIIQFMDVGLKPQQGSIYKMYEYMNKNSNTGGCCGYMGLKVERAGDQFGYSEKMEHLDGNAYFMHESLFSIQKAQMFEYHFGHLIDKPFQAWFNFIHVLPGAFSCYRYSCLVNNEQRNHLNQYLKLIQNPQKDLQTQNRYLAQDRTLSLILKQAGYDFAYLPNARAVVDPASNLIDLIGQRRRWINGTWFAFFYVFSQRGRINDCVSKIQFYYYYITNGIVYSSIALFFISLFLVIQSIMQQIMQSLNILEPTASTTTNIVTYLICFIYITFIGSLTYYSVLVKNTDKGFQKIFFNASTFFGLYGLIISALMIYNVVAVGVYGWDAPIFNVADGIIPPLITRVFMVATVAIFVLQVLFSFSIKIILQIIVSVPHFLFYAPTYLHILQIYAFCKIDDFSWGTKGIQSQLDKNNNISQQEYYQQQNMIRTFRIKKFIHIYKYFGWNFLLSLAAIIVINYGNAKNVFIAIFTGIFAVVTALKLIFSILYLIKYYLKDLCSGYSREQIEQNRARGNKIVEKIEERIDQVKNIQMQYIYRKLNNILNRDVSRISRIDMRKVSKIQKYL